MRAEAVRALPMPPLLNVPLGERHGPVAKPEVGPGRHVHAGQRIGSGPGSHEVQVHSPADGTVLGTVLVATATGEVPAVRIEALRPALGERDAKADPWAAQDDATLPRGMSAPDLDRFIEAARAAGLTDVQPQMCHGESAGVRTRSLSYVLDRAGKTSVAHLIINCLAGEPLGGSEFALTQQGYETLMRMGAWLGVALPAERIWIAVDRAEGNVLRHLRSAARGSRVRIAELVNKYPQHAPPLLAHALAAVETPPGADTLSVGVLVLQAEVVLNLAAALAGGGASPWAWTHRTVTVAGPPVIRPGRYRVPFGTSFADILEAVGLRETPKRIIDGGPITGKAVADVNAVTTKQTSALLVLDQATDRVATPGPCVRCGWCQEDCPVGLNPQLLLSFAELGDRAGAREHYPQACLECGVCSYVCPAELPLAEGVAMLKRRLDQ